MIQSCCNLKVLELRLELEEYCSHCRSPITQHFQSETDKLLRCLFGTWIEDEYTGEETILAVPKEQAPKFKALNL